MELVGFVICLIMIWVLGLDDEEAEDRTRRRWRNDYI